MGGARRVLVTEAEYLSLPETMERMELIDGEVVIQPHSSFLHQELLGRVLLALGNWADGYAGPITIGLSPLDVKFAPNRILQPDAFVVLARLPFDQSMPITRVPELCIEVLPTDRVYDRVTKRLLYAAAGVAEYWIVERGLIERWIEPGLAHAEEVRAVLRTPLLPGFELDIERLFRGLSRS